MATDILFEPLAFRQFTVKNRIWRSNISGRFDNYDGSGSQARINWELKFARGGVGAIVSSFVPVLIQGRILPNYATIDRDERIPFWRELVKQVHAEDCRFLIQLSHGGRQRDIPGFEQPVNISATAQEDPLHGFECTRMDQTQIDQVVAAFADGARRAQQAGADGVELHSSNGYLINQFLSSAINDRTDGYGGDLKNRYRFLQEVIASIRAQVGRDFHLQAKLSATESCNAMNPGGAHGNVIADSVQVAQWLERDGVDAIHVSHGGYFPHPRNPAGDLPVDDFVKLYDAMISSGAKTFRNYKLLRGRWTGKLFRQQWLKARGNVIEGCNLGDAAAIKQAVSIPVLCTGGFQTASVIRRALLERHCDAVTIARPLIANNDLVKQFAAGKDQPASPCTYCNKCLINAIENPLGCYDESRFPSREAMVAQVLSVFDPAPFR